MVLYCAVYHMLSDFSVHFRYEGVLCISVFSFKQMH